MYFRQFEHQNNAIGSDRVLCLLRKEVCFETGFSLAVFSKTALFRGRHEHTHKKRKPRSMVRNVLNTRHYCIPDRALPDLADPAVSPQHGLGPHHLAGPVPPHLEDPVGEEPAGPGSEPDALLLQRQSHSAERLPAQRHPHFPGGSVAVCSPHPHRTCCAQGGSSIGQVV